MAAIDNKVAGRLALVTGASGGIGGGCARSLAALGCNLALHYSASLDKCESLRQSLAAKYPSLKITMHKADMRSAEETAGLCEEAEKAHGAPVLILVVNAGAGIKIPHINDISISDFDNMLSINLRAPFVLCKAAVPKMQAAHFGRIVTISSISARGVGVNGAHYAASKGGLQGMMRNLATRLAKDNISVNDVAPGMIEATGMIPDSASVPGVQAQIPLGRLGQPDEIGNIVAMFVTTGYVTGQSLIATGGLPTL